MISTARDAALDHWVASNFDAQVRMLQASIRVPTDTPPGNNTPHAEHTAQTLEGWGWQVERHPVPAAEVHSHGLESITNLIVRRRFGAGPTIALNAHGDVVPPGDGWTRPPYGGVIEDGRLYGRAAAVSKSDFATYAYALRALEEAGGALHGTVELHFTYDEEFGGELGPGWLLRQGLTRPDLAICAGFSYHIVTAHNGCLQLEVTLLGRTAHAALPGTGVDALQAATRLLTGLYAQNAAYAARRSRVAGIEHPTLNVGRIEGGTHTNVVPGRVVLKIDRRMIPEEDPAEVESELRTLIAQVTAHCAGIEVEVKRLVLARALTPLAGNVPLVTALQTHGAAVFGEPIAVTGTPLYTDARLYCEAGVPVVLYGAGPRTVLESNAKRADEHVRLDDLQRATRVVARAVGDLLR